MKDGGGSIMLRITLGLLASSPANALLPGQWIDTFPEFAQELFQYALLFIMLIV